MTRLESGQIQFDSGDFLDFQDFKLNWRWTENDQFPLSPEDQKKLRPLNPSASNKIWKIGIGFSSKDDGSDFSPNPDIFEEIKQIETKGEASEIKTWLESCLTKHNEEIVVSWQPDSSLVTDVQTFLSYWESFCYPSSDDTSIFPLAGGWIVHYWHEEILYFGIQNFK